MNRIKGISSGDVYMELREKLLERILKDSDNQLLLPTYSNGAFGEHILLECGKTIELCIKVYDTPVSYKIIDSGNCKENQ